MPPRKFEPVQPLKAWKEQLSYGKYAQQLVFTYVSKIYALSPDPCVTVEY
jgi:hypothetical protein